MQQNLSEKAICTDIGYPISVNQKCSDLDTGKVEEGVGFDPGYFR